MCYKKFENNEVELFKSKKKVIVKDKVHNNFFVSKNIKKYEDIKWTNREEQINPYVYIAYLGILLILSLINIYILFVNGTSFKLNFSTLWIAIIYSLVHVFFHEGSHIVSLKCFGRKIDKVGFKFNYLFPAFYIKMNDMYMLTNKERIIVHSSGIMFNLIINTVVYIIALFYNNVEMVLVCRFFSYGILCNSLPLLNSDGYKVLITILDFEERTDNELNIKLIKRIKVINWGLTVIGLIVILSQIFL